MKRTSLALLALLALNVSAQNLPKAGTAGYAPDDWLLAEGKSKWWYNTTPSSHPTELKTRQPTKEEQVVIERVQYLMKNHEGRAFALLDGDTIVYQEFKAPATAESMYSSLSMGKTLTAMAVGQAICDNKLKIDTQAATVLPELTGTALGKATVKDLLTMASGSKEVNDDSSILTKEEMQAWKQGKLNLLNVISSENVSKAQKGIFSEYKPGEHFAYKSTDPFTLGMMIGNATGMPFTEWLQESVLDKMGAQTFGFYRQDPQKHALADSGISTGFDDYLRFAVWVQKSSKEDSCFGSFVRDALKTEIKNPGGNRKAGGYFDGYGYFTWTDNRLSPDSAWASGHGGQRISWHKNSNRMVVVFSTMEDWMEEVYKLDRDWAALK